MSPVPLPLSSVPTILFPFPSKASTSFSNCEPSVIPLVSLSRIVGLLQLKVPSLFSITVKIVPFG